MAGPLAAPASPRGKNRPFGVCADGAGIGSGLSGASEATGQQRGSPIGVRVLITDAAGPPAGLFCRSG
ncbi:MAG: hypothetical protein C5B57_05465 [Blastocatellia bacterium]|nr:MAG: hypothetical protein C5B57_05465 [Blastocatellia bacterium]